MKWRTLPADGRCAQMRINKIGGSDPSSSIFVYPLPPLSSVVTNKARMTTDKTEHEPKGEIPGRVTFLEGRGELPMVKISTGVSTAEVYRHGAHVTHFKKNNEPPLLFLSQCSRFAEGQPIRGGIPVVFPWFGPREGLGQHGFARLKEWELKEFAPAPDGSASV